MDVEFATVGLCSRKPMMENSTKAPNDTKPEAVEGQLRLPYVVFEVIVALFAVIGNSMVILVFYRERSLRRRTN